MGQLNGWAQARGQSKGCHRGRIINVLLGEDHTVKTQEAAAKSNALGVFMRARKGRFRKGFSNVNQTKGLPSCISRVHHSRPKLKQATHSGSF